MRRHAVEPFIHVSSSITAVRGTGNRSWMTVSTSALGALWGME